MGVGADENEYLQQLINLTPPGTALPTENESNWVTFLSVLARAFALADAHSVLLLNELYPDTTTLLLPNWERVAGIPDECFDIGETYEIRRLNLIQKLTSRGGQSKAYFIELAASLGYEITITEFRPFRCGISRTSEALCDEDWWFAWQVNAPESTIVWFRVNVSGAQEPLASWGNERLECIINKYKPAHTTVLFAYS